jgi:hypothetical protein
MNLIGIKGTDRGVVTEFIRRFQRRTTVSKLNKKGIGKAAPPSYFARWTMKEIPLKFYN